MLKAKLLGATAAAESLAIEDVFSTYLYKGNGSTQTITNGIDLAGEGGLVWQKNRVNAAYDHNLFDTARGVTKKLITNGTFGNITETTYLTAFNSNGFSMGSDAGYNKLNEAHVSWTFRQAPRFFDVVTYTGTGANRTIAHDLGVVPGCIIVKRTDTTSDWQVYHRSNANTEYMVLNTTAAKATGTTRWNSTTPTSTVFSLGTDTTVNASGGTYVAYLFAHDPLGPSGDGSDGLIACGSYTGNGSATGPVINIGWEPQWLLVKNSSGTGNWAVVDSMRGFTVGTTGGDGLLYANTSGATDDANTAYPTATGFGLESANSYWNASGNTYIYIAIRRGPMREPTVGTQVYSAGVVQNNTGRTLTNPLGYPSDMAFTKTSAVGDWIWQSRLTGTGGLSSNQTYAESTFYGYGFDNNTNYEADGTASIGAYGWNFRRAPGFFDVVAYTGNGTTGRSLPHNLGVAPELMIFKTRSATFSWAVSVPSLGANPSLILNSTIAASSSEIYTTAQSATTITLTNESKNNANGETFIAYLFASLPGISKVGSYTGNGSSQTINCAFTTGARFVLIKRTDSTGDWYVWDTARGIVSGNDPHLSLNTTAAEVTSNDTIDPDSTGFIVNQVAATNVNVNAATYIYLAIA